MTNVPAWLSLTHVVSVLNGNIIPRKRLLMTGLAKVWIGPPVACKVVFHPTYFRKILISDNAELNTCPCLQLIKNYFPMMTSFIQFAEQCSL